LGKTGCNAGLDTPILVNKAQCHPEKEAGAFPADDERISWITGRGRINGDMVCLLWLIKRFLHHLCQDTFSLFQKRENIPCLGGVHPCERRIGAG